MKNIFTVLFVVLISFVTKAQVVEHLFKNTNYGRTDGTYYKDVDNDYAAYVGTWVYANKTDTLRVILQKKEMLPVVRSTRKYYADRLVGEYQYIENNIDKVNTLSGLSINHNEESDYSLYSAGVVLKVPILNAMSVQKQTDE